MESERVASASGAAAGGLHECEHSTGQPTLLSHYGGGGWLAGVRRGGGGGGTSRSRAGAVERGLDLLDGGADEAVDGGDGLGVEPGRRQVADEDLERDGDHAARLRREREDDAAGRARAGPRASVGEDGEARRQERDARRVLAAHHHVRRRDVDRRVHHQRPRRVRAALLEDQHAVLVRVEPLHHATSRTIISSSSPPSSLKDRQRQTQTRRRRGPGRGLIQQAQHNIMRV